jgi:hypothetical protein
MKGPGSGMPSSARSDEVRDRRGGRVIWLSRSGPLNGHDLGNAYAEGMGLAVQITFDCHDADAWSAFWALALDCRLQPPPEGPLKS